MGWDKQKTTSKSTKGTMGGNSKRRNQTKLGPKPIITNSTKKAQWEGTLRGEIKLN